MTINSSEILPGTYTGHTQVRETVRAGQQPHKNLIVGYGLSAGTASNNSIVRVVSKSTARKLFGTGSMLQRMAKAHGSFPEGGPALYALQLAEPVGGAKATASLNFGGTATEAGSLNIDVAGDFKAVAVAKGDTAATVAGKVVTAFNEITDKNFSLVVNGVDDTVVDFTANHNGSYGNEFVIYCNDLVTSDSNPAGLTVAITAWANGAGEADLSNISTLLGDHYHNYIAIPDAVKAQVDYMGAALDTRAEPLSGKPAVAFCGINKTATEAVTFLGNINQERVGIRCNDGKTMPNFERAAYDIALIGFNKQKKPAIGLHKIRILGDKPAPDGQRYDEDDRRAILQAGGSVDLVVDEQVYTDRIRTTALTDGDGEPTKAFQDLAFLAGMSYGTWFFNRELNDFINAVTYDPSLPAPIEPGVKFVSENSIRAKLRSIGGLLATAGVIENLAQFRDSITVIRTGSARFDTVTKANYSNGVYILANNIEAITN